MQLMADLVYSNESNYHLHVAMTKVRGRAWH